jgi:hypothetical protein
MGSQPAALRPDPSGPEPPALIAAAGEPTAGCLLEFFGAPMI